MPSRILALAPKGSTALPGRTPDDWVVVHRDTIPEDDGPWDLVLVNDARGESWALETAATLARRGLRVVIVADSPSLQLTASALAEGVADVMAAPPDPDDLRAHLAGAAADRDEEVLRLTARASDGSLVGRSPEMLGVFRKAARAAAAPANLFLFGEPGTGKRALAHFIHEHGERADGPFVELSCVALPDHLLESELFGHEKGTFPWAVATRRGRLERASGGTLFLDHVDRLPVRLQLRLLEVLRRGASERVGGGEAIPLDLRVVAAATEDPARLEEQGRLLPDLRDELASVSLGLPPLRERASDLALLASHFGALAAVKHRRPVDGIGPEALRKLETHDWPGNLRELRAVMDEAVLVADGPLVLPEHLPDTVRWPGGAGRVDRADPELQVRASLEEVEAAHIRRVVRSTRGNLSAASEILGIHRNTLRRKVDKYGITT